MQTKSLYQIKKYGANFGLFFRGSLVESGVFTTRATALRHKRIAENEYRKRTRVRISCDQCQMLSINGMACHEHGCPNSSKVWEQGEWVKYRECRECGCDVRDGEQCDCQETE